MIAFVLRAAFVALLLTPQAVMARDGRQDAPGQFDFYVLSLSWSPSFCTTAGGAETQMRSAGFGPIRSWCTACGHNMTRAFQNIASYRRRGSTTALLLRCSI